MGDLTRPGLMYLKAGLFVAGGIMAAAVILLERPGWRVAAMLAVCVWCFCRAYYFAFYVIEHYIDPGYRYAGLGGFVAYLVRGRREAKETRRRETGA